MAIFKNLMKKKTSSPKNKLNDVNLEIDRDNEDDNSI